MSTVLSVLKRHPALTGAGAAAVLGLAVFALLWFQPQKLFIDQTVSDAPPVEAGEGGALASGSFQGIAHETTGMAHILRLTDGSLVLRLEDLDTTNGPDLRVYLSEAHADTEGRAIAERVLDLGALRGNRGDQNYAIPAGTDVSAFRSVVIWCRRFTVGFGAAPLR